MCYLAGEKAPNRKVKNESLFIYAGTLISQKKSTYNIIAELNFRLLQKFITQKIYYGRQINLIQSPINVFYTLLEEKLTVVQEFPRTLI